MDLYEIFEYDTFANKKVLGALQSVGHITDERITALLSHIAGAHHNWLCRIGRTRPKLTIWPELSLAETEAFLKQNQMKTAALLEHRDFDRVIAYENSKGESFENTVREILYHVANHSNYHRGQIATRIRDAGMEPVVTDFIVYKRQGA